MIKLGAIALGAFLLFSGIPAFTNQPAEKEIYYRDSAPLSYAGSGEETMETMKINYSSRTLDTHTLALQFPTYNYAPVAGACAAIAGGNVIGFFDRYDENLIPNHSSGTALGNTYMYSIEDSAVQAVIRELYSYMGTTVTGTTEANFKNGLTNFCNDKGHSIVFSSCMQGGSFSYSKAKSYLNANQPIVLFLSGYNVIRMVEENSNRDSLTIRVATAAHIMIGFGYKTYVYDGNNVYNYLSVASGVLDNSSGLFNINYKTNIDNALAVNII